MGIPDKNINADPFGLALGSSGLTPVQMAVAFGTIANKGVHQQPLSFLPHCGQQRQRRGGYAPAAGSPSGVQALDGVSRGGYAQEAVQSGTGTKAKDFLAGRRGQDRHELG